MSKLRRLSKSFFKSSKEIAPPISITPAETEENKISFITPPLTEKRSSNHITPPINNIIHISPSLSERKPILISQSLSERRHTNVIISTPSANLALKEVNTNENIRPHSHSHLSPTPAKLCRTVDANCGLYLVAAPSANPTVKEVNTNENIRSRSSTGLSPRSKKYRPESTPKKNVVSIVRTPPFHPSPTPAKLCRTFDANCGLYLVAAPSANLTAKEKRPRHFKRSTSRDVAVGTVGGAITDFVADPKLNPCKVVDCKCMFCATKGNVGIHRGEKNSLHLTIQCAQTNCLSRPAAISRHDGEGERFAFSGMNGPIVLNAMNADMKHDKTHAGYRF